jgi:peroxiredoxin
MWQFQGEVSIGSPLAVDALLDQVFAANPRHPAHHYRIHLWDSVKPARALASAALSGVSAPGVAHQWHMAGHIYSDFERFADAAWEQEAAARVDHGHMMHDHVLPDQIHNYVHNQEWLIRDLMHIGRSQEALSLAKNLVELPRHPKYNTLQKYGTSAAMGRQRLFEVLTRFELWDDLIALAHSAYLEPTDIPDQQIKRLRTLGMAYAGKGDAPKLEEVLAELEKRAAVATCPPGKDKGPAAPKPNPALEDALRELRALEALGAGDTAKARDLLKDLREVEKPRLALLHLQAGNKDKALELASQTANNRVVPLGIRVHVLASCGKMDEAKKMFSRLRELSGHIDNLEIPLFRRLAPVVEALGLPADWRCQPTYAKDRGVRPAIETLGPLCWRPVPAPDWSLPQAIGPKVSLQDYKGKPVVILFYLGHGCPHCVEQLNRFTPMAEKFRENGIALVAISSDTVDDSKLPLADQGEGTESAFPILSDPKLEVFKAYRAFDDFESKPLHGTFLIDASGALRWQDVSYEPFLDAEFLFKEAQRLLKLPN